MKCICVTDCFDGRRYRPGDVEYFDELPMHFVSAADYKIADDKKQAAAMSPARKLQADLKKVQAENKKLRADIKKFKAQDAPSSKAAPKV